MYNCPKCGNEHPDREYKRKVNEKMVQFPQIEDKVYSSTPDYQGYDWTEVHFCEKCKEEYSYENSSY